MNYLDLFDIGFKGNSFAWWNGRIDEERIFERLDKIFVNRLFQEKFGLMEVEHLAKTGSDHSPLFITMGEAT